MSWGERYHEWMRQTELKIQELQQTNFSCMIVFILKFQFELILEPSLFCRRKTVCKSSECGQIDKNEETC